MTEVLKARQSMLVHSCSTVMHSITLLFVVAAAILAAQVPALAEPIKGDPVSGREIATKQCSSCHNVLPRLFSDRLRIRRAPTRMALPASRASLT
jgi:hypothetical protein